jgi:hypothetical protein
MTEKEIFVNMIKRVSGDDSSENFWVEEENGDFSIFNDSYIKTTFKFDNNGNLEWFY